MKESGSIEERWNELNKAIWEAASKTGMIMERGNIKKPNRQCKKIREQKKVWSCLKIFLKNKNEIEKAKLKQEKKN